MENHVMTPEEFKEKMLELSKEKDVEDRHVDMDDLMTEVLMQLGYFEGVKVFYSTLKWYA